jgi:hypothetical protein
LVHPLNINSAQPSEEFRMLRTYMQQEIKVPCRVTATNWRGKGTVMLNDNNYANVSLIDIKNIMEYLKLMYKTSP